ncbi:hypothetical protein [Variovorax boronicumulans]|uniref:hypothetical protein n=1 Tax=Variovorax boronicumulans TaxID=436515 RepID=UPI0012E4688B|nr:hypothetical protein [Variovorax boronicumulans]GER13364.1 hypothetical protein VHAB30_45490 [Variovorax boronicumulans]GER18976.1 hypothetical protein VCH24_40090 [Variovorax boronicumulans]
MFRARFEGEKLPSAEAAKHTRAVGDLVYMERVPGPAPGRGIWAAMLLRDDGETYIIPVLDRAHLRRTRGGILISGMEVVPRGRGMKNIKSDDYPQTWWCRPVAVTNSGFEHDFPQASPAESRRQAREFEHSMEAERIAESINRRPMRRMPYDPATASGHYLGHF